MLFIAAGDITSRSCIPMAPHINREDKGEEEI